MVDSPVYVTTVTPFSPGFEIDEEGTKRITEHLVGQNVSHIVPLGTSGEFSSLTLSERKRVVEITIESASNAEVIAGVSSTALQETVELSKHAKDAGASSVLIVPPFYLRPSQDAFVQYVSQLSSKIDVNLWIYNNPAQTKIELLPDTIWRLSEVDGVVGVKDATADMLAHRATIQLLRGKKKILGGLEEYAFFSLLLGSDGFTSSIANFLPALPLKLYQAFRNGNLVEANRLNNLLVDYRSLMLNSSQPLMMHFAKLGLKKLGIIRSDAVRPPLAPMEPKRQETLERELDLLLQDEDLRVASRQEVSPGPDR